MYSQYSPITLLQEDVERTSVSVKCCVSVPHNSGGPGEQDSVAECVALGHVWPQRLPRRSNDGAGEQGL